MRLAILFVLFLFPHFVGAEYRAYKLRIGKPDGDAREIISTLDHVQYPGYYPVNTGEVVSYVDSWMCWGRTEGFESICAEPTPPEPENPTGVESRAPASEQKPGSQ